MNMKRMFLVLAAALLMPGLAMAGNPGPAEFKVNLTFDPDGKTTTAYIQCNGVDTPNSQQQSGLGDGDNTTFNIESSDLAAADCDVWVDDVPGYDTEYVATGPGSDDSDDGCIFDPLAEETFICDVVLTAEDVTFTVTKEWDVTRVGGDLLNPSYGIDIICTEDITDSGGTSGTADWCGDTKCAWNENTRSKMTFWVEVDATGSTPSCWAVEEDIVDSAVDSDDSDCTSRPIGVNSSSSCTIVNTVFYEGIPTLNQYGLAIMALLMLGVGFVGFRRFV